MKDKEKKCMAEDNVERVSFQEADKNKSKELATKEEELNRREEALAKREQESKTQCRFNRKRKDRIGCPDP